VTVASEEHIAQKLASRSKGVAFNNNDNNNNNVNTNDDIYSAIIYDTKPYVRVYSGPLSGSMSVSARWLLTHRPSCKLDL